MEVFPMIVTYLGQCGFLIECGKTRIVTDPYLSYCVDNRYKDGPTHWERLYAPPATLDQLRPDAVLISHSHDDHMDPETIGAYQGDALFACPAPESGKLRAMREGLHIREARAEEPFTVGEAEILPVPCAHTELHTDDMGRFRELSYFVRCGGVTLFFGGDMSLYDGLTERVLREKPGLLLLPCNGRDEDRTRRDIIGNIDENEAAAFCKAVGASAFVPAHHDLYEANGCSVERIELAAAREDVRVQPLKPMESLAFGEKETDYALEV
jgi:L-ascorbate 6-phosphate lactonase